jgi:GT2 family glycosyltransferase
MTKLFEIDPGIGIVNPSSNSLGQKIPKGVGLDEYAKGGDKVSGLFVDTGSALGFCMLMKRELFKKIGRFDEAYGMGNFDDTDFSLRAKREGFKTVRAFGSYVYHRENISFNVFRDFKRKFNRNKWLFDSRWGITKRAAVIFKEATPASLEFLQSALRKHAKEKSWLYIITPPIETKKFFEEFSNLTFHHFGRLFYLRAFLKVLSKRKKPSVIYCDNKRLLFFLERFKFLHRADLKMAVPEEG